MTQDLQSTTTDLGCEVEMRTEKKPAPPEKRAEVRYYTNESAEMALQHSPSAVSISETWKVPRSLTYVNRHHYLPVNLNTIMTSHTVTATEKRTQYDFEQPKGAATDNNHGKRPSWTAQAEEEKKKRRKEKEKETSVERQRQKKTINTKDLPRLDEHSIVGLALYFGLLQVIPISVALQGAIS